MNWNLCGNRWDDDPGNGSECGQCINKPIADHDLEPVSNAASTIVSVRSTPFQSFVHNYASKSFNIFNCNVIVNGKCGLAFNAKRGNTTIIV